MHKIHQNQRRKSKHLCIKMNIVIMVCVCGSGWEGSCSVLVPPAFVSVGWMGMEDGKMFQGGAGRDRMNGWEVEQRLPLT